MKKSIVLLLPIVSIKKGLLYLALIKTCGTLYPPEVADVACSLPARDSGVDGVGRWESASGCRRHHLFRTSFLLRLRGTFEAYAFRAQLYGIVKLKSWDVDPLDSSGRMCNRYLLSRPLKCHCQTEYKWLKKGRTYQKSRKQIRHVKILHTQEL